MEGSEAERERATVQSYLAKHKINDLLYSMLETMCLERPDNPHQFVVDWMTSHFPSSLRSPGPVAIQVEAVKLADDDEAPDEDDKFATEETPGPGTEEVPLDVAMARTRGKGTRRRSAVSSESYDPEKIMDLYEHKVHHKSDEQLAGLKKMVANTFLFSTLDAEQMETLLAAMFQRDYGAGETIIRQGDEGDNFYVIYSGECDVYVHKDGEEKHVLACREGDSFGELALMYNAPRAATVKAKTPTTLFAVDRTTFKFLMMGTTIKKRETYASFLEGVSILSSLTKMERQTIADALKPTVLQDGEVIIQQGEVRLPWVPLKLPYDPSPRATPRRAGRRHLLHCREGRSGMHVEGQRYRQGDRAVQAWGILWRDRPPDQPPTRCDRDCGGRGVRPGTRSPNLHPSARPTHRGAEEEHGDLRCLRVNQNLGRVLQATHHGPQAADGGPPVNPAPPMAHTGYVRAGRGPPPSPRAAARGDLQLGFPDPARRP